MKWIYLATAPDQLTAEMWRELLWQERIPAEVRAGDVTSFLGVSPYPCRLMVSDEDHQRAKEILETYLETAME